MKVIGGKSFWLFLAGINVTSGLLCLFSGSMGGALVCALALCACMISSILADMSEKNDK